MSFTVGIGHRALGIQATRSKKVGRVYMKDLACKLQKYLVNRRKHGKVDHCLYGLGRETSGKNYLLVFHLAIMRISPVDCKH